MAKVINLNELHLNNFESNLVCSDNIKTSNPFSYDKTKLKYLLTNTLALSKLFF